MKKILGAILLIIGVIIIISAIGGGKDDEPTKVGDIGTSQSTGKGEDAGSEEKTVFGVGEQVNLNDVVVTLVDVSENEGDEILGPGDGNIFVLCEFEIENNSSKDIAVSSVMSFEAYVDDYSTTMSITATTSTNKNQLDGSVAAGKKMNGVIGYEVPEDWKTLEVNFTPEFWSEKDITFVYSK